MVNQPKRVPLRGSEKAQLKDAQAVGPVPDDERFEVTVRLRAMQDIGALNVNHVMEDAAPGSRRYLTRAELAQRQGASSQDLAKVTAFAQQHGLAVVEADAQRRSVVLSGNARAFSQAFGVTLQHYEHEEGIFRGREGAITVPAELDGIIEGVFGLDDRPQARPHYQRRLKDAVAAHAMASGSFTPPQLAEVYRFPTGLDGAGECIGIIELGGGYRTTDLKAYFTGLGLPVPSVKTVSVDHGRNHPSNANSADGEVMLDIEVAAAIAPKARIVVYFAPNTDQGFLDAVTKAVHDSTNQPSVISISWGSAESAWTSQAMTALDQAFQAAAAVGVTVCVAAGDNGSADGVTDGQNHVDFPASSPYALGCGGTRLVASGASITSETVWNEGPNGATGGGISVTFPKPAYQQAIAFPQGASSGRGVPDVAGDADPETGYQVRVDGQAMVIGGTSAVAPLYAGLVALLNQKIGKPVGYLNPILYGSQAGKGLFTDVTQGNNGAYSAGNGWDACTGWGSPVGAAMESALSS